MEVLTFLCLSSLIVIGVFGDEVKSVMEGDSVTLHSGLTHIQTDDVIGLPWIFATQNIVLAKISKTAKGISLTDNEMYRDRLQVDNQTGDLTITNITPQLSGLYQLMLKKHNISYKNFSVTVHPHLPVPVITRNSSSSSSSDKCVVSCSVMNVSDVSLSWYKGMSLLSNISVSDLNIRLSLHLEVEYQDTNTYTCVINNTITNQTQHLHITQHCQPCSDSSKDIIIVCTFVGLLLVICGICFCVLKHIRRSKKASLKETSYAEVSEKDEESSINSSSTSDAEASRFLNRPATPLNDDNRLKLSEHVVLTH